MKYLLGCLLLMLLMFSLVNAILGKFEPAIWFAIISSIVHSQIKGLDDS